jgi:hypothetical protein
MEKQLSDIPVLQRSKDDKIQSNKPDSSCCSQPSTGTACCAPSKTKEENNGACCAQPENGSPCCDK